jgi:putative hemolysin
MEIFIIFILTLINGIFALSEIALVSLKRNRIEQLEQKGNTNARIVLELLEEPENFLSSIQVGITLIGVVAGAYGGSALADDVEPLLRRVPLLAPYAEGLSITLIVGLITYFTIVIGELIPKTIALRNAERVALTFAPFIKYFSKITYPIVKLLSFSTTAILRLLGIKEAQEESMTEEELRALLKSAGKKGVLEWEESLMHQNLFVFTEQRARNLMTHRTEVEWVDMHQPIEQLADRIKESAHSKFLVCDGSIDKIRGVITAKEFFEKKSSDGFMIESIFHEPMYVPETMYTLDILTLFKKEKEYLAVVVDEFGSVEGIITLHDLMEAIVGDLPDLDEADEPEFLQREDSSYLVSGSISIHQFNAYLEKELIAEDADHYTTLGGFIISQLNKIPSTGEKFDYKGYSFEVVDLDGQRIDKVIVEPE